MSDEYVRKQDALVALMDNDLDHIQAPNGKETVQILSDIPAADVAPVVHARWRHYEGMYACEACGAQIDDESPFCPMCGAKMYEGDEYG